MENQLNQDEERRKRSLNLGWQAESTIIPKKRQAIQGVGSGTLLNLKAEYLKKQEELRQQKELGIEPKKAKLSKGALSGQNAGVAARSQRDEEAYQRQHNKAAFVTSALERKAALYEKVVAGDADVQEEIANVDFLQKRYDQLRQEPALLPSGSYQPGLVSRDMEREHERREWEDAARRTREEEIAREAQRAERHALIKGVALETAAGRSKAAEDKSEKERAAAMHRERLKQAFLEKQLAKLAKGPPK